MPPLSDSPSVTRNEFVVQALVLGLLGSMVNLTATAAEDASVHHLTRGAILGATVALCSGFLEQDVGSLIQKQRGDADYIRWKKQNEFDGQWRADLERSILEKVHADTTKYFSPAAAYRRTTYLTLPPYDFKFNAFKISTQEFLALSTGEDLVDGQLKAHYGITGRYPEYLSIRYPLDKTVQPTGLSVCPDRQAICFNIPEVEAKTLVDPARNPNRLVYAETTVRITSCENTSPNKDHSPRYQFLASPVSFAFRSAQIPQPSAFTKFFKQNSGKPKSNYFTDPNYNLEASIANDNELAKQRDKTNGYEPGALVWEWKRQGDFDGP